MLITYILQVTLCLAFFYAFYYVALHKLTLFQTNRIYLIITLIASMVLPLIRIYIQEQQHEPSIITAPYVYVGFYLHTMSDAIIITPRDQGVSWLNIFWMIYITGVLWMSIKMISEIKVILKLKRQGQRSWVSNQLCILSGEIKSPFSFFNTVYLPADHHFTDDELAEIISHEKAHVQGGHTLDILFMELACIGLWPSPMVYLYRKKIREVHEYLADAEVLRYTPWENYASFLVAQKNDGLQYRLSNQLIYSQLKNRLIMMTQRPSTITARLKYLGLIPVLLLTLLMFSFREKPESDASSLIFSSKDTIPATYITALRLSEPSSDVDMANENKLIYDTYDDIAIFPGCDDVPIRERGMCSVANMTGYISNHLVYPASLKKVGLEGKVIVRFTVGIDGFIKNVAIQQSLHPDADEAALNVINSMNEEAGRWRPARKEGKTMEAEMWLPITFSKGVNAEKEKEKEVYTMVEEMPRFPGCEHLPENEKSRCANDAMFKYIYQAIKYPQEDREKGNEGLVIAQFTVETEGSISNARVVRGASARLNAEILRVVNGMNDLPEKWIPGRHEGKAVPVEFTLPFKFVLQADPSNQIEKVSDKKPENNKPDLFPDAEDLKKNEDVHLYPNPTNVSIRIDVFEGAHTIKIFDISGRLHITQQIPADNTSNEQVVNISLLPEGQYMLQVLSDTKTTTMNFGVAR